MRKLLLLIWAIPFIVFCPPKSVAQTVYFQRFPSGTVSSVSPAGPASTLADLAGGLSNARFGGVESNGFGLIFYADRSGDQILAVDSTTGNIFVVLLPFSGLSGPQAISLDATGNFLYVSDVGNNRIVRVNLSAPLPANRVQVVVDQSAGVTEDVGDLKYNPSDGFLYWTNGGAFHRARVSGQPMPVESGETLLTANSIEVRFFDFDRSSPQRVIFSSGSGGFQGLYSANVPRPGDTPTLSEANILDTSATPDVTFFGVAIDKIGPYFCYTAADLTAPVMRCGDRTITPTANFTDILSAEFTAPPNFMVVESPSSVVMPDTKLAAPVLQLNLSIPKPAVRILLKPFDSAALKAAARKLSTRAGSGKIGFRYVVDINKTADSSGKKIPQSKADRRRMLTMRNDVTAKNLGQNSTYQVRYNIEITRKERGEPIKIVKRTALSPVSSFVVPKRGAS